MSSRNALPSAAALYCRISHDRGGESLGVQRQEKLCRDLAQKLGWTVGEVFIDNDASAYTGAPRPRYEEMLEGIRAGAVDGVVCVDLDRLTRHPRELEAFISLADEHDVHLANVSGDIHLQHADGRFRARILGAVARNESEKKSERLKRQREQAAQMGLSHGGRRPFGYEPGGMVLRDSEVTLIREAVERLLAGESLRAICTDWNRREVASAGGGAWRVTSLRTMIAGPRIAGLRVHQGEVIGEAQWPAVIDRNTHEAIRALLGDPRRHTRGRPAVHLMTGLLRCGRCDGTLHHSRRPDGTRRYSCSPTPGSGRCGRIAVTAGPLEELITDAVIFALAGPTLERLVHDGRPADGDASDLVRKLAEDEARLDQLARDHYADALISRSEFLTARDALTRRMQATRTELAESSRKKMLLDLPTSESALRELWDNSEIEWRRTVVKLVLDRVVVQPGVRGRRVFDPDRVVLEWAV